MRACGVNMRACGPESTDRRAGPVQIAAKLRFFLSFIEKEEDRSFFRFCIFLF